MLQAEGGVARIFFGGGLQSRPLLWRQRTHDLRRASQNERALRNLHPLRDQGFCTNETLLADVCAVENDSSHSNQTFVLDRARMNYRAMPYSHIIADDTRQ